MEKIAGGVALAVAKTTKQTSTLAATGVADGAARLAHVAFGAALVLSPFRARIDLVERVSPPLYGDYTSFLLFWSDIAVLATLALWSISLIARRRGPAYGPFLVRWPAAALLALVWVSAIRSIDPSLSVYTAIRLSVMAALALYVFNEQRDPMRLLPAAALMVVIQAVVAVGQVLDQHSLGWGALGEHTLDPTMAVSVVAARDGERLLRGYGLTDHPNILGGVLAFGLLVLLAGLPRAPETIRTLLTVVVAVGTLGMALTFSRGGALAFAVAFIAGCALLASKRLWHDLRWWLIAALAAALVLVIAIEPYGEFVAVRSNPSGFSAVETEQRSMSERGALVEVTNDLIVDNAFVGTGAGTVALAIQRAEPDFAYNYQPAHVVLLNVGAELGLAGALAYSLLVLGPWVGAFARRRRLDTGLIAATALVTAVTVVGLFDYYTWTYAAGQFWFWVAIGLWAGAYTSAP